MNIFVRSLESQLEHAKASLESLCKAGMDTAVLSIKVTLLEAQLATSRAVERLEMFEESKGDDRYSATRAAAYMRGAGDCFYDAARAAETLGHDPHAEILRDAGIKDT